MKVWDLFAGIGGMSLGLKRAGMTITRQVEINDYCRDVLAKHWPHVPRHGDIRAFNDWLEGDGAEVVERPDLICGGFPCQPVSLAGKRRGDADKRWLWPELRRCLRLVRPRWALVENTPGLLSAKQGRLMGSVVRDLAELGYCVEWDRIPAADVGAWHLRKRVWIVADTTRARIGGLPVRPGQPLKPEDDSHRSSEEAIPHADGQHDDGRGHGASTASGQRSQETELRGGIAETDADADSECGDARSQRTGRQAGADAEERRAGETVGTDANGRGRGTAQRHVPERESDADGARAATGSDSISEGPSFGTCFGEDAGEELKALERANLTGDGIWATEPGLGRVVHGFPGRVDRVRALGNAVVPQLIEFIGRRIMKVERERET